ncbi:MAG: hypothetical protein WD739_09420 [Actinomycetota bacterium]
MAVVEFTWGEVEAPNVQAGFVRGYMGHNSRAEPFYLAERHYRWGNSGERAQVAQSAALGKVLVLSWKTEFGGHTWTEVANGEGDAAMAACLSDLLTITEGAREVHLCTNHEPENDAKEAAEANPPRPFPGTPADFRAAHRRFVDKVVRPLAAASDFPVKSAICLLTSGYLPSLITLCACGTDLACDP